MTIFNFTQDFPDENACIAHFKAQREQNGVVCCKCGGKEHYWLGNKLSYECKRCHSRQSLRSRTVMEHTKLPFRYWYVAMHLLTSTKKSFSSTELQRQLGHKRYQPIWELTNKLRDVMGKRDSIYQLKDQIELDNDFIITLMPDNQKDEPLKRGAGSQKKTKVVVMVIEPVEIKNKKPKRVNQIKMQVVDDMKADTVTGIVKEQVDLQAVITSDDSTSYKNLINRRYFGEKLFDRLVMVAVWYPTDFKSRVYNRSLCG